MSPEFSLEQFESLVASRDYETAHEALVGLINTFISNRSRLPGVDLAFADPTRPASKEGTSTLQRIADAITALLAAPQFRLNDLQFNQLFSSRHWLNMLFVASSYGSVDHILRALLAHPPRPDDPEAAKALTRKQIVLYTIESEFDIDLADLAKSDPVLATSLGMSVVSSAVVISPAAHEKRERLIEWLPRALESIADLDDLPGPAVCGAYMHCSYSDLPNRHAMKRGISQLVRRKLGELGLLAHEADVGCVPLLDNTRECESGTTRKPLMIVVLEWFNGGHSIYRTHSRTMLAARERFEVVAFGEAQHVDAAGREVFDRFIPFEHPEYVGEIVRQIQTFARENPPAVLYMPSVGMFPHTIFMTNVRVAPLQIAALGHPATMHAQCIDYVSVEEDFVGDPACFSEKLMRLPKDGQPYVPSKLLTDITPSVPARGAYLNIAVTASAMKLNPRFLDACRQIIETAGIRVCFHFMTSWSEGLDIAYVRKLVESAIPRSNVLVYGGLSYSTYLKVINAMDMFVSPFPFGNTNGIVDAFTLGLPGVNLCGPEVFEHIDSGLFERAGMPAWLTAHSIDEYVRAAVRLATQHDEREALRRQMIEKKAVERIFEGRPEAFGRNVLALLNAQAQNHAAPHRGARIKG
ncbi:adhesin [Paraburkholderia phymatum]|uniref:Putative adhesin processing HmwC-like protein n=1 Tax=Paraburkholderia phymatum (strain DSM 17167 / CIP 108236 / LMG 21445 / STM815) TaxID=391038 RepID=B2JEQ2_PARP8|nr:adhesin [Paraburkholderia phymatum]ACC71367.1 putative adhesin processing HmwC-like protein [Paraburkholderia phymatum STM815]